MKTKDEIIILIDKYIDYFEHDRILRHEISSKIYKTLISAGIIPQEKEPKKEPREFWICNWFYKNHEDKEILSDYFVRLKAPGLNPYDNCVKYHEAIHVKEVESEPMKESKCKICDTMSKPSSSVSSDGRTYFYGESTPHLCSNIKGPTRTEAYEVMIETLEAKCKRLEEALEKIAKTEIDHVGLNRMIAQQALNQIKENEDDVQNFLENP